MPDLGPISEVTLQRFADYKNPAYASLADLLGDSLPTTRYRQFNDKTLIKRLVPEDGSVTVLDIGCGSGKTLEWFRSRNRQVEWSGVEIEESYNIADLNNLPPGVNIYDGVNLPFAQESFDFCFSSQVFEHVRRPNELLRDIHRVLKRSGVFFGSVSGGETYHWHSLYNYTALGWKTILEDNGFKLREIYSGIDALSLMLHHWSADRKNLGAYFQLSVLNRLLANEERKGPRAIRYENALKLAFAGHLIFYAEKNGGADLGV